MKFSTIKGAALALGLSVAAAATAAPTNKQLTIGVSQEFENLNPIIRQMVASTYIGYMAMHPLVAINADWKWQCYLCTELPTIENGKAKVVDEKGKKKVVVNWEIKPNAQWGDGKPVTGEDVKLGWEIGRDPSVSTGSKDVYERIESIVVDKTNPKKFTMTFKEARYDYNQLGTFEMVPAHLEGPVFAKTKGQVEAYEKQTKYTTDPTNPGLYNGAFVVKEIKLGSHVILVRNDKYYGQKPAIDKIIMKYIPNTQTLEANLMSGTIDMVAELGMTFDQALAFEKRQKTDAGLKGKYTTNFVDGMTYEHIDLNLRNPILADVRVRKALVYAIDRDKLTQALFEGRQKKALSWVHPKDLYFTEDLVKYESDPKKAEALLAEAGWKKGGSGFLEKDGKKLTLNIMTTSQNKTRELVQVFLQEQWKKVGIEVTIQNEPARVFFGETVKKGKYPAMAMFAWVSSPDNPPRSNLHSKEIPTEKNGFSGQNSGGWSNPKADKLLEDVYLEFNDGKRKAMMVELQKHYTDEVPVIPLYMRAETSVTPSNMTGYKITGHQFYSTLAIDQWNLGGSTAGH
jgi:peptide/nickel transport system substrate-binding protein